MAQPTKGPTKRSDFKEEFLQINDARLFYRSAGEGPPLVFVHAGIADSRLWRRQLNAFADQYRVITYDLRGYGKSEHPSQPFAHYRDLADLLDALDIDSAHFVGASMGGATVLDFALEQPHRVTSLTLAAPAIGGYEFTDEETLAGWAEATEAFEAGDFERAATIESAMWLAGPDRSLDDVDSESRKLVRSMLLRSYELENEEATESELEPPAIDRLDELSVPMLLIIGELDTSDMTSIAELLEGEVPTCRLEVVNDAAHLPSLECPKEFEEIVGSFLEQITISD